MKTASQRILLTVFLTGFATFATAEKESCALFERQFADALTKGDLASARGSVEHMERSCTVSMLTQAKREYTGAAALKANDLVSDGQMTAAESLLDTAMSVSWMVSSVRGDIASEEKNWKEAAAQYGQAFELLSDPGHVKQTEQTKAMQKKLFALAAEAQVLYGKLDQSVSRSGEPSGIFTAHSRGVSGDFTPIPVQFEFNQHQLSEEGKKSAQTLANYLKGLSDVETVVLVGHTDTKGSEAYNQRLSERRAATMKEYLAAQGVDLNVTTQGKGESVPPVLSDPERYTREERDALARRVEFQLR